MKALPERSVDLILTDPVYENVRDYGWLGREAMRLLKPDRSLLVWGSMRKIDKYIRAIERSGMHYRYTLTYVKVAKVHRLRGYHLFTWATPILWFTNDQMHRPAWGPDTFVADEFVMTEADFGNGFVDRQPPDTDHPWNKNMEVTTKLIERWSEPGWRVLDPFSGRGTVPIAALKSGRTFWACERDHATYEAATVRIDEARRDMFIPAAIPIQMELA